MVVRLLLVFNFINRGREEGDVLVVAELLKSITELADKLAGEGVESLGSVEVQNSDAYESVRLKNKEA